MRQAYQVITDRIVDLLESGTVPWRKPWGGEDGHPKNLVSGKKYRGINTFMLSVACYDSPYWLTFKQAKQRGGYVKKGEKGFPCIYWNTREVEDRKTGETKEVPFMRYYTVFNVKQCENVPYPINEERKNPFEPIELCERILAGMPNPPSIDRRGTLAVYSPRTDQVTIPEAERFLKPEYFYSVLFHELIHSTGHPSRLARPGITEPIVFGSETYSKEELVAEMGATFLCGHAGIENIVIENSAAYIEEWLSKLRNDNRLVVQAASQAQRAADYVLGL